MDFETRKELQKNQFKYVMGEPFIFVAKSKIYTDPELGKKLVGLGKKKVEDKDADLMDCFLVNAETGVVGTSTSQIIVPAIMKDLLATNYPKDAFIGKMFRATIYAKTGGKRYNTVSLDEVSPKK